ncbi:MULTISPECIES: hypothetical protein [unclassified Methylophilus]|uniref:hypothetical protein n=1 Tax=unclassified Methylophilus TaxID=2630143 RepID=UPI0003788258|nr:MULTISPECIES: hypothetical protein [unclassified Methylophilus]
MKQYNDGLDDLREQNLRDPLQHAHALFSIEREVKDMSNGIARISDDLESLKDELEAERKFRYEDRMSYLPKSLSEITEINRSLRHIKVLMLAFIAFLIIDFLK